MKDTGYRCAGCGLSVFGYEMHTTAICVSALRSALEAAEKRADDAEKRAMHLSRFYEQTMTEAVILESSLELGS